MCAYTDTVKKKKKKSLRKFQTIFIHLSHRLKKSFDFTYIENYHKLTLVFVK